MKHFLFLAALLAGPAALAQANEGGNSDVTYNDFAAIHWIHPGEGCDEGKYCFQVRQPNNRHEGFPGLEFSLIKISRPALSSGALIMGQTSAGEKWFVYDLSARAFVVPPGEESQALDEWIGRDLPAPEFWDAKAGGKGLQGNVGSFFKSWGFYLFLIAPVLMVAAFPICVMRAWRAVRRYRLERRRRDLVVAGAFLLPAALILLLFLRVFVPVFWR